MLDKIIQQILSHKKLHITWVLILTFISLLCITGIKIGDTTILDGLRVDNSMEVWFKDDDPAWLDYKHFQKYFEGDEFAIVAFSAEDIFTEQVLLKIKDLTKKFDELPYIAQVISLTNIDDFRGQGGTLRIAPLFETIPKDPQKLKKIRTRVTGHPLYQSNIISADGKTTAILIRVRKQEPGKNYHREITDLIMDICENESEKGKYEFHVSGSVIIMGMEDRASTDDATLAYGLLFIILVVFLYIVHRRIAYVLIPLTVVGVANIWIHGIIPVAGSTYNMITNIIAILVMVIGIADTIHFISEYNAQITRGLEKLEAVKEAFKLIVKPCLFTSLTTAMGFMSMSVSELQAVKEFGIYAGIALILTFFINMIIVSIWLSTVKDGKKEMPGLNPDGLIQKSMRWTASINRKSVKINIAITALVILISITGLARIEINTHEIKYFRESHPLVIATNFIEKNLTGTVPLEILLTGKPDTFTKPDVLKRIDDLENHIKSIEHIQTTFSVADYIKEINRVLHNEDPAYYKIPKTENAVSQLLLLTEGEQNELENYLDFADFSTARIHGRFNYVDTKEMQVIIDSVNKKIEELFSRDKIEVVATGSIPLYLNAEEYILDSQIYGFGLALFVIFVMLSILVRSLRLGFLAMAPNITPIFLTYGIMGWLGIYLDMGTVLIASVAIGLAVDDTIHFIARFRHHFDEHKNYDTALLETLKSAGSPITITSIVLFFGFLVLLVSTFMPVVYFGLLTAITMVSALVADLFVLPALIKVFKPFGKEG